MQTRLLVAPDHPMFIPDISGEHLKDGEMIVNGLLKLVLKASSEHRERLVIISPDAVRLHHRFAVATGEQFLRTFASNTKHEHIVNLAFPGDTSFAKTLPMTALDMKVPVEVYTQENQVTAIDNAALSLLYYADQVGWHPKVTIVSLSDLPARKYTDFAKALAHAIQSEQMSTALCVLGHVPMEETTWLSTLLAAQDRRTQLERLVSAVATTSTDEDEHIADLHLGMMLALYLAIASHEICVSGAPEYHPLAADVVHDMGYAVGYY